MERLAKEVEQSEGHWVGGAGITWAWLWIWWRPEMNALLSLVKGFPPSLGQVRAFSPCVLPFCCREEAAKISQRLRWGIHWGWEWKRRLDGSGQSRRTGQASRWGALQEGNTNFGGRVGPKIGLDTVEKNENYLSCQKSYHRFSICPAGSLVTTLRFKLFYIIYNTEES